MLDHISLRVQDYPRALAFYRAALAPLGYRVMMEFPQAAGLGADKPDIWIGSSAQAITPTHIALAADREAVDAFHAAALAAGGSDNGPPGLRAEYHPHYYAAFVFDPEGNNIEVVCHADPEAKPARKLAARKPAARKAATKLTAKAKARPVARAVKKKAKPVRAAKKKPPAKKKRR